MGSRNDPRAPGRRRRFRGRWLGALRQLAGEVSIDALVDHEPAILERAALAEGLPPGRCFTDVGAALADNGADMALVVVPPEAHRPVALRCLEAGLPVLVEKPLAGRARTARRSSRRRAATAASWR